MRDSSLSACTQAVIAAEVGHLELAYDYFAEAALMDLDNLEHNTRDGLHIASLAGTWIVAVAGFGGMRDHDGALSFTPRLPQRLTRLAFGMCFRGRRLRVEVTHRAGPLLALARIAARAHPSRAHGHGDHRPAGVLPHPCARRKRASAATPWPQPGTPARHATPQSRSGASTPDESQRFVARGSPGVSSR